MVQVLDLRKTSQLFQMQNISQYVNTDKPLTLLLTTVIIPALLSFVFVLIKVWHVLCLIREDMYAQDSIELLTTSGIQFKKHEDEGIETLYFAELLMTSGVVLCDGVKWLSFHRYHAFAGCSYFCVQKIIHNFWQLYCRRLHSNRTHTLLIIFRESINSQKWQILFPITSLLFCLFSCQLVNKQAIIRHMNLWKTQCVNSSIKGYHLTVCSSPYT